MTSSCAAPGRPAAWRRGGWRRRGSRVALVGMGSRPGWEGLSARSRALLAEEGLDAQSGVIAGPFARRGMWADGRAVEGTRMAGRALAAGGGAARSCALAGRGAAAGHGDGHEARRRSLARVLAQRRYRSRRRCSSKRAAGAAHSAEGRCCSPTDSVSAGHGENRRERESARSDCGWCWWAQHGERALGPGRRAAARGASGAVDRGSGGTNSGARTRARRCLGARALRWRGLLMRGSARSGEIRLCGWWAMRLSLWIPCRGRVCTRRCAVRGWRQP